MRDVQHIGTINIEIYQCVTQDIKTEDVIITPERIKHIKRHHPGDFEMFSQYLKEIVERPDYILEANKPNTALILKEIITDGKKFKLVLRLVTQFDHPNFKSSILTFMKIDDKEWNRLRNNKKILYKADYL